VTSATAHAAPALALGVLLVACGAPARDRCDAHPPPGALGSICGFDRPEDLVAIPDAGLVLASGMAPGAGLRALAIEDLERPAPRPWRIWPPASPDEGSPSPAGAGCAGPPDPALFFAHGLTVAGDRVAVVNHGGREAIELFELAGASHAARLRWRGCIPVPEGVLANDVAIAPDGEILATHFVARRHGLAQRYELLRAALGFETGEVIAWREGRGWRAVPGTRGAGPNGLVLSPDGSQIFFAENGRRRVVRVPREGIAAGQPASSADVRFHVDNLAWTADDRLLAIVHTGGLAAAFQSCLMDWALWEVDPRTLAARERFRHDGSVLCGATSAIQLGDRFLFGTMSEARVGVWRPAPAAPAVGSLRVGPAGFVRPDLTSR
jgi:hypothetical protein